MNQIPESARRRLQAETAGDHPDADLLTAFSEQSLTAGERERVLLHLAACANCREVVSVAAPEEPEAVEVAAPAAQSWFRWPVLRWTAVAATVIVVGAAVSVLMQPKFSKEVMVPAEQSVSTAKEPASGAPRGDAAKQEGRQATAPKKPPAPSGNARRTEADGAIGAVKDQPQDQNARDIASTAPAAPMAIPQPGEAAAAVSKMKALDEESAKKEFSRKDSALQGEKGTVVGGSAPKADNKVLADNVTPSATPPPPPAPPTAAQSAEVAQARRESVTTHGTTANAPMTLSRTRALSPVRWRASGAGAVEHSNDGSTWEKVEIDPAVTFRAISSNDGDLWAGGSGGALFHSKDSGRTWSRLKVGTEGMWVSDAITGVDFSSPQLGYVSTASGAIWTTQDSGQSWRRLR